MKKETIDEDKLALKQFEMLCSDAKKRYIYYPPPFHSVRLLKIEYNSIMKIFAALYNIWRDNNYQPIKIKNDDFWLDHIQGNMNRPIMRSQLNNLAPVFLYQEQRFYNQRAYKYIRVTKAGYLVLNMLREIEEGENA